MQLDEHHRQRWEAELLRVHQHAWARALRSASLMASARREQPCPWFAALELDQGRDSWQAQAQECVQLAEWDGLQAPSELQACLKLPELAWPEPERLVQAAERWLPGFATELCKQLAAWSALGSQFVNRIEQEVVEGPVDPWRSLALEARALTLERMGEVDRALEAWDQAQSMERPRVRIQAAALAWDCDREEHWWLWAGRFDGSEPEWRSVQWLVPHLRRRRARRCSSQLPLPGQRLLRDCPPALMQLAMALE